MATLPEDPNNYPIGITQLETNDPVIAGVDGIANRQAIELGNRTANLKKELQQLLARTGLTQTDIANAIALHQQEPNPHPNYMTQAETSTAIAALKLTANDILRLLKTVDGNGSGLDADLLDGLNGRVSNTPNTLAVRDGVGDINARLFRSDYPTQGSEPIATASFCFRNNASPDNYIRTCNKGSLKSYLGLGKTIAGYLWLVKYNLAPPAISYGAWTTVKKYTVSVVASRAGQVKLHYNRHVGTNPGVGNPAAGHWQTRALHNGVALNSVSISGWNAWGAWVNLNRNVAHGDTFEIQVYQPYGNYRQQTIQFYIGIGNPLEISIS